MSKDFCKSGCGNKATHKGWCKIKWRSGNKFGVACPIVEKKRGRSISRFRLEEAKLGKNPMQNPEICRKNHSPERNRKAAESLKKLGSMGLLPQQTESEELKERRRIRNQKALQKLWKEGKHPLQSKSKKEFERIKRKISKTLSLGIIEGKIKPSYGGKRVSYKNLILRSTWEKEVAQFLDKNNIKWEYENMIIPYYDIERNVVANTIPDFYLPEFNVVIEVKGRGYDSLQTKDKMEAISALGYNTFLFGETHMKRIRHDDQRIIKAIKNEKN